ncbi:hypothetical protein J3Q64DRAFT_1760732 [Phycomyces blakesleeanus]|uniref:Uncharacterized protein n=2 Tax=Phycomyces blakesleeanus TaxID=4837 RepID=A0A167KU51_PHYB8|nr:hypothetical protein PHYBLDRAFT_149892 [Phycomyces blakesleeanus NRRL 1555(-)]OAD68889.1 hypothetical protein PHYBLDRAFT_149892 [Phycomyces blakesleeanus NRRL 1555(-)]|eukprot:XP_018286929.1 hypothetical protein PHYBLDRAFT_149892 [Phycomyces blakesleeanus NRRL 1555(-)]
MSRRDKTIIPLLHSMQNEILALKSGQEDMRREIIKLRDELANRELLPAQSTSSSVDTKVEINLNTNTNDRDDDNENIVLNISSGPICRPVSNIRDITLKHVYRMISQDLGIEVTKTEKSTLHICTKFICNEMAALPSVQALGSRPSWGSIPKEDKEMFCNRHASMLKDAGMDFTRCHGNWASIARVSHLWRDRQRRS